jgi:hypothetical protein
VSCEAIVTFESVNAIGVEDEAAQFEAALAVTAHQAYTTAPMKKSFLKAIVWGCRLTKFPVTLPKPVYIVVAAVRQTS